MYSDLRPWSKRKSKVKVGFFVGQASILYSVYHDVYHDTSVYRQLCERNFTKIFGYYIV